VNLKVILLLVGLVVGGLIGYVTRPEATELRVGNLSIEVQSNRPASPQSGGSLTTGQWQHLGMFAAGGAIIGLLIGFVADRRRI
jgi:hypothetical protein